MSAPSGPIQIIPPGLLGLLQLKNMGRLPDTLQGDVQPTLDLTLWWLRGVREVATTVYSAVLAAGTYGTFGGFSTPLLVPDDEWWYVHNYTVLHQVVAANSFQNAGAAARYLQTPTLRFQVLDPVRGSWAGPNWVSSTASGFWLPPGSELGYYIDTVVGAAGLSTTVAGLEFSRCQS